MRLYRAKVETPEGVQHLMGLRAKSEAGTMRAYQAMACISFTGAESTVAQGKWVVARVPEDTDPNSLSFYAGMHGDTVEPVGEEVELHPEQVQLYLGGASTSKLLGLDLESVTQSATRSTIEAA